MFVRGKIQIDTCLTVIREATRMLSLPFVRLQCSIPNPIALVVVAVTLKIVLVIGFSVT